MNCSRLLLTSGEPLEGSHRIPTQRPPSFGSINGTPGSRSGGIADALTLRNHGSAD